MSGSAPGNGREEKKDGTSRLIGNCLAFFGSVAYAWYEVWYKMHGEYPAAVMLPTSADLGRLPVALPDPEDLEGVDNDEDNEEGESLLSSPNPAEPTDSDVDSEPQAPASPHSTARLRIASPPPVLLTDPSITTFLLYSNVLTALIGITTLLLFWIPIPILHYLGWEPFETPPSNTWLPITGIVLMGVVFNAGFMVLLSLWGPVVAVSCSRSMVFSPG